MRVILFEWGKKCERRPWTLVCVNIEVIRKVFLNRCFTVHKKVLSLAMIMAIVGVSCTGCSKKSDVLKKSNKAETEETEEVTFEDGVVDLDNQKRTMTYADGSYIFHNMVVDESAKPMPYDLDNFVNVDGRMTYEGDDYTYRLGVDVSKYQDEVKWNKGELESGTTLKE